MSAETVIYSVLTNNASFTSIFGTRLFPNPVTDPSYPMCLYQRTNTEPTNRLNAPAGLVKSEITITIWTENMDDCQNYATTIVSILNNYKDANTQGVFWHGRTTNEPKGDEATPLMASVSLMFNVFTVNN